MSPQCRPADSATRPHRGSICPARNGINRVTSIACLEQKFEYQVAGTLGIGRMRRRERIRRVDVSKAAISLIAFRSNDPPFPSGYWYPTKSRAFPYHGKPARCTSVRNKGPPPPLGAAWPPSLDLANLYIQAGFSEKGNAIRLRGGFQRHPRSRKDRWTSPQMRNIDTCHIPRPSDDRNLGLIEQTQPPGFASIKARSCGVETINRAKPAL